jgi:aspartokinase/homoserine dehydrogenase 1
VKKIQVHAIDGSMIIAPQGVERLLAIREQSKDDSLIFIISPITQTEFEFRALLEAARARDTRLTSQVVEVKRRWTDLVTTSTLTPKSQKVVITHIEEGLSEIDTLVRSIWLTGDISRGATLLIDAIVSRWCATFFHSYISEHSYTSHIDLARSFLDLSNPFIEEGAVLLLTGELPQSIASQKDRDSEYTASLVASKIGASSITYWNANRLVTTADLSDVPSASVIDALTYAEATELSFFGSDIIRPQHMVPAISKKIPLYIRSFEQWNHSGTLIDDEQGLMNTKPVKGFSVIRDIAVINVEGAGMIGVPGIARRLFSAMHEAHISVSLISQASSEYSICFAVPAEQAALAQAIARSTFRQEIQENRIHSIEIELGNAILAAVGEHMSGVYGIAGSFFGALGKARVNVRAIAQGSSERNISAVIKEADVRKALRALHASFFLSNQTLSVGVFGPGNIGGTLLDQIASEAQRLHSEFGLDIRIRAISNSRMMLLDEQGIDLNSWKRRFEQEAVTLDIKKMVKHISASYFPHSVLIDSTSSDQLPIHYEGWIERGIHIITPNKKAGSAPYPEYKSLMDTAKKYGKHFLYETTVGAGLPVIGTLKDLIQTGDTITSIEGIVSGTLAYLFWRYDGTEKFSALVKDAKEQGYTEPDPRDDLSGMDVARKTVILARELGYEVELEDIAITSLVPKELEDVSVEEFMSKSELMDDHIESLFKEAEKEGKRLRYVGHVAPDGSCTVHLTGYPINHPFAQSKGTDNVVAFTTKRYHTQPLVIQGPGAGPEVTAAGVFADLLRLGSYLGARL